MFDVNVARTLVDLGATYAELQDIVVSIRDKGGQEYYMEVDEIGVHRDYIEAYYYRRDLDELY